MDDWSDLRGLLDQQVPTTVPDDPTIEKVCSCEASEQVPFTLRNGESATLALILQTCVCFYEELIVVWLLIHLPRKSVGTSDPLPWQPPMTGHREK